MKTIVDIAKVILCRKFKIGLKHFNRNSSRERNIIDARRFLCYYLRYELGFTFVEITNHIPAITNHATVLHHCRRLKDLFDVEPKLKNHYNHFIGLMQEDPECIISTEISDLLQDKKDLSKQIYKLKKLLK